MTTVQTGAGALRGAHEGDVLVFRGVPYAAPPVGDLRFRPPQPVAPWDGERDATRAGLAPVQTAPPFQYVPGLDIYAGLGPVGEDCLYLNVWTPAAEGAGRPVLVWVPGGAFIRGAGSQPVYDGALLAREADVVVVTINYRLGALGFLLGEDEGAGNLGLRDQIAALRWVRDNAAAFGGDPDQVTVLGESAGAISVGCLLVAPEARGLFRRAVGQSGIGRAVATPELAQECRDTYLAEVGETSLARLRELPVERLLEAQTRTVLALLLRYGISGGFQPWVDGDLLPEQPVPAALAGRTAEVPLLAGWNAHEMALWRVLDPELAGLNEAGLFRRAEDRYGVLGRELVTLRRTQSPDLSPTLLWESVTTDVEFGWPTRSLAAAGAHAGRQVHLYRFEWAAPVPDLGACHFLEVPFVFGTLDAPGVGTVAPRTAETEALSATVRRAWTTFARTGTPELPDGAWPVAGTDGPVVVLDGHGARRQA
ncbi:MAG: carboxylesterase family protein [Actinomycetota bacterium]|nr:carboxylesterase family protein [Actinomycetota bacterium]